jgi:hypothetical protein
MAFLKVLHMSGVRPACHPPHPDPFQSCCLPLHRLNVCIFHFNAVYHFSADCQRIFKFFVLALKRIKQSRTLLYCYCFVILEHHPYYLLNLLGFAYFLNFFYFFRYHYLQGIYSIRYRQRILLFFFHFAQFAPKQ